MADSRQQIYELIDRSITDEYERQNTALVVRTVLKYLVQNMANLADDDFGVDPNPAPKGAVWDPKPTITEADGVVSVSAASAVFDGETVPFGAATFSPAAPAAGQIRQDAVYGNPNGTYGYVLGEAGTSAPPPTVPSGSLIAGYVIWSSEGVQVQEPVTGITRPEVLELLGNYLHKDASEYQEVNAGNGVEFTAETALPGGGSRTEFLYAGPGGPTWGRIDRDTEEEEVSSMRHNEFKDINGSVEGVPAPVVVGESAWQWSYAFFQAAQGTVLHGAFNSPAGRGYYLVLLGPDKSPVSRYELSDNFYKDGVPFSGGGGSATPSTPAPLTDAATLTVDLALSDKFTLAKGNIATTLSFANAGNGKQLAIFITGANGTTISFPTGYTHYMGGSTAGSVTLPASGNAILHGVIVGSTVWWALEASGGNAGPTLGTGALAVASGAMTVPMTSDGVYYAASYPASITVDTTGNSLGRGVVVKVVANGTTAPTIAGATKHNNSANFNTTNGTSNTLRVWCEYNASNVKTNYYIWTQQ